MLAVHPEVGVEHGGVGVHVEHALVDVPHHPDARVAHRRDGARHLAPVEDALPGDLVVVERPYHHAGNLDIRPAQRAAHLGQAGLVVVFELHESGAVLVVHGFRGLKRGDEERGTGPLHDGQHRAAERVGAHETDQEVHLLAAEHVAGLHGHVRMIHQPAGHDGHPGRPQTLLEVGLMLDQPLFQAGELLPVEPAATAEHADFGAAVLARRQFLECDPGIIHHPSWNTSALPSPSFVFARGRAAEQCNDPLLSTSIPDGRRQTAYHTSPYSRSQLPPMIRWTSAGA